MATMSVSGVVSGMDWDSMIDEIITKAAQPAQVKVNKKTNLTNKKSLFEEMKVTMNSLQSSLSPLKLPSTYKAKTIDIERIDTSGSYKGVLTATVNADAEVNVWDLKVNKLATAQVSRSKQITSSTLASTLNGLTSSTFYVNMGGQKVGIEVNSTDTLQSLKSRINNTLKTLDNPLAVTASVVDNKLILKSDNTGLGTRTATETINYNISGVNRLSNISVTSSEAKNLKITSNGKSYTYGTDFTVANGNEIRWKQYERGTEVGLNRSVTVNYTMDKDDVYEATGKYGSDEAKISGFTMTDNGTLSKRVKIKDSDGNEYEYGKDFTLDDNNKVVWLEEEKATTNEPDTYTVSYTKSTDKSYSVTGEKTSPVKAPASYTVSYDKTISATVPSNTASYSTTSGFNLTANFGFSSFADMTSTYGVTTTVYGTNNVLNLNSGNDKVEILNADGTKTSSSYTYGYGSSYDYYLKQTGSVSDNSPNVSIMWTPAQGKPTNGFTVKYTHSYTTTEGSSSFDDDVSALITAAGTDTKNIKITSSDGTTTYTYGTDYDIDSDSGAIIWKLKGEVIDIPKTDTDSTGEPPSTEGFTTLQAKYAEATKANSETGTASELKTVTLIDGDGVLRTYADPDDPSILTMKAGGQEYQYGRDYVLRVNDSGTGYRFEWAVEGDTNRDGSTDVKDFSTVVATYAAYKNISTSDWKQAPADSTDDDKVTYTFGFDYELDESESASVKSSDTDKSLATLLSGVTLSSSDYSSITITDSSGNEYTYGADWTISDGSIEWLDTPADALRSYTATYKFSDADSFSYYVSASAISASGQGNSFTRLQNISDIPTFTELRTSMDVVIGTSTLTAGEHNAYITKEYGQAAFTLKTESGKVLEYGKDYAIRSDVQEGSSTVSTGLFVVYPNNSSWPWEDTKDSSATRPTEGYTLSFTNTATDTASGINVPRISQTLGFTPKTNENLTITSNGKTYTYTDGTLTDDTFTLDSSGYVKVSTPTRPADGASYTLYYEAFDALTAETTYEDGKSTQEVSITVDSGYGKYKDKSLSYEQILSDLSLTSSSTDEDIAEKFADNFSLTDGTTTYTYGTDYTIIQGLDTDSSTSQHSVKIKWLDTAESLPSDGAKLTLTYTGRGEGGGETITTGVKRSATDSINPDTSSTVSASYATFSAASKIRIAYANENDANSETFFLGEDFTISDDGLGNAVINWSTETRGAANYDLYFDDATSITVTNSSGKSITGFTVSEDSSGNAVLTMDDGSILDDTYTVKVVKDGRTTLYDMTGDGINTELGITRRSAWLSQDDSSEVKYKVYVTANGQITEFSGTRAENSYDFTLGTGVTYPKASDFESGTTTITQGTKTFYENEDFIIDEDEDGNAQIYWLNDSSGGSEWFYPTPGSSYTINHTDSNGNTKSYTAYRSASTTLNMYNNGLTTAGGTISVQYADGKSYKLEAVGDEESGIDGVSGHDVIKSAYSIDIAKGYNGTYVFNWVTPTLTTRTDLPSIGDELTVEYEYDANTFTITGDAATLLGLNDDVTEAQDAELEIDGELVYRASNDIGADYDNELIKGVTMHLKGTGEVSLDISHDAQKAVESIQSFVDTYNDLMTWMNTRMTESEVDKDTAATIDSDDFRMRWGLLHGNSLLRSTKSQMRSLVTQNFTFSFTQRKSSSEIYGTMGYNGLRNSSTLRLRIGTKYVDVTIDPTDTLQTIVDKINDDTKGGPMNDIYYDENGNKLQTPLLRASADNDVLTINSTTNDEITMSGSAAMNALKMNYTYKGLYQIGIATTSDDYGKSGELEFDTEAFMTALEDNPDEVQELMLKFVTQFDTWTKGMLNSSASGETSGTLTREIENLQSQIDDINDYLEDYQDRLDRMEEQLRTKYANTETSLSKLTQQASSIAAILNQLNGYSSNNSSSS